MKAQYISVNAAALRMGVSISLLTSLRREGRGPNFVRLGGRIVYDLDDLDQWAESQKRTALMDLQGRNLDRARLVPVTDLPTLLELFRQRCEGLDFPDWSEVVLRTQRSDTAVRHAARRLEATGILSLKPFRVTLAEPAGGKKKAGS
jgi:predicted DNA-binding transcriptional regulator AlpA